MPSRVSASLSLPSSSSAKSDSFILSDRRRNFSISAPSDPNPFWYRSFWLIPAAISAAVPVFISSKSSPLVCSLMYTSSALAFSSLALLRFRIISYSPSDDAPLYCAGTSKYIELSVPVRFFLSDRQNIALVCSASAFF